MDQSIHNQPTPREDPWDALAASETDVAAPEETPRNDAAANELGLEFEPDGAHPTEPVVSESADQASAAPLAVGGGGCWTIPTLCAGIAVIACCLLIPQADANRRMAYERQKLVQDLESIRKQVAVNDEFLKKVADDPNLAERLAQRQMKIVREGTRVLELKGTPTGSEMSPFHLVNVAPPPPLPPYKPLGGFVARLCYHPRSRLYLMGGGLMAVAAGLVLGYGLRFR